MDNSTINIINIRLVIRPSSCTVDERLNERKQTWLERIMAFNKREKAKSFWVFARLVVLQKPSDKPL